MTYLQALEEQEENRCDVDRMDIDDPAPTDAKLEPFSDAWFADLDESIDTITKLFEELQTSELTPEDQSYINEAEHGLCAVQDELMDCLTTLEKAKRRNRATCGDYEAHDRSSGSGDGGDHDRRSGPKPFFAKTPDRLGDRAAFNLPTKSNSVSILSSTPGDNVMQQLFRWWRPRGPCCIRGTTRLHDARLTEVDGRLIQ